MTILVEDLIGEEDQTVVVTEETEMGIEEMIVETTTTGEDTEMTVEIMKKDVEMTKDGIIMKIVVTITKTEEVMAEMVATAEAVKAVLRKEIKNDLVFLIRLEIM